MIMCGLCHQTETVFPSRLRFYERPLLTLGIRPFRCVFCNDRFYVPAALQQAQATETPRRTAAAA
jgi:hypothetical protein